MSLNITPLGQEKPPEPEAPKIYSDDYRSTVVDSMFTPEQFLLTQAPGTPRQFRYYRQHLRGTDEARAFQPGALATYQSYVRYDKMIVKQEGDGSFAFDPESAESSKTYSGYMAFSQPPIMHDVLITDIGQGRAGLFAITNQPEIRNFTASKAYYITFILRGILDRATETALEGRVVDRLVYSKDSALHGGAEVITHGEEDVANKLFQWNSTIATNILRHFFWSTENSIGFERAEVSGMIHDPYLTNFLNAFITPDMRGSYPPIQEFSIQHGGLERGRYGTINIWEVLLKGDLNLLPQCKGKATLIDVNRIMGSRFYGNLSSSKFRYFVSTDPQDHISYNRWGVLGGYPIPQKVEPGEEPVIAYMFSEGFYQGKPDGEFENMVHLALTTHMIDHPRLLNYCETYFSLTRLEQLYHGAVLLLLLKQARRLGGYL